MYLLLLLVADAASAAPCTSADSTCTDWVTVAGGPARVLVYRTYPLDVRNETITRALVVVHGGARDADQYYGSALAAGFLAGALDDTIIIAPRFASNAGAPGAVIGRFSLTCRDTLAPSELNWPCTWESSGALSMVDWRTGGAAVGTNSITTFDAADEILLKLANKTIFPNLRGIVVAGHSGGGVFVTRYAMANQLHDRLAIPITYVAANGGAYPYLDNLRPSTSAIPAHVAAAPWSFTSPSVLPSPGFAPFPGAGDCASYNSWPYGLQHRTGDTVRLSEDQLKKQFAARSMTYLLGQYDTIMIPVFDASCAATAQGPNYLARGLAWGAYVKEKYEAKHQTLIVPSCGHNERCMFTADVALPVLFPKR
jgi:hypothetical protein